jgi:hypothetical protein
VTVQREAAAKVKIDATPGDVAAGLKQSRAPDLQSGPTVVRNGALR